MITKNNKHWRTSRKTCWNYNAIKHFFLAGLPSKSKWINYRILSNLTPRFTCYDFFNPAWRQFISCRALSGNLDNLERSESKCIRVILSDIELILISSKHKPVWKSCPSFSLWGRYQYLSWLDIVEPCVEMVHPPCQAEKEMHKKRSKKNDNSKNWVSVF